MRRRDLIAGAAAAAALPAAARAQQAERVRRVGLLHPFAENDPATQPIIQAFDQALPRLGWIEGNNIRIDRRFAAGDSALFKRFAAELVDLQPDAILAGTPPAVLALQQQTRTTPIVFALVVDPVGLGLVQSLAHPGGNITGFSVYDAELAGKWVELLKEIAPQVTRIAAIFNPDTAPYAPLYNRAIEGAARAVGMTVSLVPTRDEAAISDAITAHAREPGGAVILIPDIFNATHRDATIGLALRHGVPLMGFGGLFVRAGALISYFTEPAELYGQAATYIDRILRGAKPADLPVQQPTKFKLFINLKTAKALGLTVPQSILQRADEVIE